VQGQVVGLARALGARGHRVTVFAPLDDADHVPTDLDLVVCGRSVSLPSNGSRAPVSLSLRAATRALRSVRRGGFDVVHVHEPFSPGLSYLLLVARGVPPLVATFHRSGGSRLYSLLAPVTRPLARRLALRCAVSEAARSTASAALGGTYQVLFNGVEVDRYRGTEPWPTTGPTVLFLGRHEVRKGLRVLLDAFAQLARPGSTGDVATSSAGSRASSATPTLWVAGDGPETERLRQAHPESPTVQWLGVLSEEEKVRRLAGATVLCVPSLGGESFGMVLLEAMAARCAVVASDIDGYRDAAGGTAVLVPPGDADALAQALALALDTPRGPADGIGGTGEASRGLRRLAASRRAEGWSMAELARRYEGLYRSTVSSDR
jgi:phosphatidylinositol alpha-mannosyltransferase